MIDTENITIVKIGGNVVDDPAALHDFVEAFAALRGPKILVHGGGKEATRLAEKMGVEVRMVDGRRITGREMLDIAVMVYAGAVNKRIVAALQAAGCNAIGLSGADADAVRARRRPAEPIDFGFVGDIESVAAERLLMLLGAGLTPVFSAIMHDGAGTLLNCNADSVASAVAVGMSGEAATELVYCFEKEGVLDAGGNVIGRISRADFERLKADGTVNSGMIPKIENALRAVAKGVRSVTIKSAAALGDPAAGTVIK